MRKKQKIPTVTLLAVLLAAGCYVLTALLKADLPDNMDTARKLYRGLNLNGTDKVLQRIVAAPQEPAESKAEALIMLARIEWKFRKNSKRAARLLRQAEDLKVNEYEAVMMLSRVQRESGEFEMALTSADRAIGLSASDKQWIEAKSLWARVIWEQARVRIEKDQPFDALLVEQGVATLKEVLRKAPGHPDLSRTLLALALLARDGEAAFTAWKSYFIVTEDNPPKRILAEPYDLLKGVLPQWGDTSLSRQEGLRLIRGLGDSRFYGCAKLIKQLHFKDDPFSDVPELRDMVFYADTIDSMRRNVEERYRLRALGKKDEITFQGSFMDVAKHLWPALSFVGERPDFSYGNFCGEMWKRFNAYIRVGGLEDHGGTVQIMGHLIDQQTQKIEQYGFENEFDLLTYDMMVSNGYPTWFWDGTANVGGWAVPTEVTSLRVGIIEKSYKIWWMVNDDAERQKAEQYIADHLAAEELTISRKLSAPLGALGRRMILNAAKAVVDDLKNRGLEGQELTMAFIRWYCQFYWESGILAHEGRHSIDLKFFSDAKRWGSPELEFRAKLSEITFSPDPYLMLAVILIRPVDQSAHGKADLRIRQVLLKWMKDHLNEIEGIDPNRPLMVQAHLLTPDQIKRCFTAADPMSRKSPPKSSTKVE